MQQMIVSRKLSIFGVAWKVCRDFSSSAYYVISALSPVDAWDAPNCVIHHLNKSLTFLLRKGIGNRFPLPLPWVLLSANVYFVGLLFGFIFRSYQRERSCICIRQRPVGEFLNSVKH